MSSLTRMVTDEDSAMAIRCRPKPCHWNCTWVVLVAIRVCGIDPAPLARAEEVPPFDHVVKQYFEKWTDGGRRTLTTEVISRLVSSPQIRGAEAAAVASIHCYQRKLGTSAKPATLQFLTEKRAEDSSLRRDLAASGVNFSMNYQGFVKHIIHTPRKVFTVEHPSLDGMSQGHLGDCYFVSGVGAAVHLDPKSVHSLLRPQSDGSCDVHFPDGRQIHVPPLTDAELALSSNAGDQGTWLNVLEVAAGKIAEQSRKDPDKSALDLLGEGGDSVFTIQLLTGHRTTKDWIRPKINGQRPAPSDRDVPRLAEHIEQQIRSGLSRKRIVCCGVGEWSVPPGMGSWHQYAILGCNRGLVHLWNPWGRNYHFEPKGTPGLQHGYVTQNGRFYMPIHDFIRVFGSVNVEMPGSVAESTSH